MSWRTSFCTDVIFDDDDYKALRNHLERHGFILSEPMKDSFLGEDEEINIISGYIKDIHDYAELDFYDVFSEWDFKPKQDIRIILIKEVRDVTELVIKSDGFPMDEYKLIRGD